MEKDGNAIYCGRDLNIQISRLCVCAFEWMLLLFVNGFNFQYVHFSLTALKFNLFEVIFSVHINMSFNQMNPFGPNQRPHIFYPLNKIVDSSNRNNLLRLNQVRARSHILFVGSPHHFDIISFLSSLKFVIARTYSIQVCSIITSTAIE